MLASSPINSSPTSAANPAGAIVGQMTTATKFLSKQDRENLLQFTKHFTRKAVQIIVQSRLGDKKPTKSRVYAYNADWFNLSIKDLAQITTMTKMSLGNVESLFNVNSPFCIEISLRTPENQTMILETWCILFNDQLVDATQKVCYSVYKKMSLVLRSLMCITRCTPTYQLSRRQSSETYVLLYRMYCGEPIVHHLGENYATAKVGTVGTPIGSIIVNVAYRTRLTMTPQNSSHSNEYGTGGIQIKDDHFTPNSDGSSFNLNTRHSSSSDMLNQNENNSSPNSPPIIDRSPRGASQPNFEQHFSSSSSSLSKRSSSNLNTISEAPVNNDSNTVNQSAKKRQSSKTQPIPMKSPSQPFSMNNQSLQLQRYSSESNQNQCDESSADEYNSSSVASTPDTIYYFKLKSAAFVPSASFTNNYYSSSISNLQNENDLPPFITLLSNDFANLSASDQQRNQLQHYINPNSNEQVVAQSPPPPHNMIENNIHNRMVNKQLKYKNDILDKNNLDQMASPCSLPNFKILDLQGQQLNNNQNMLLNNASGTAPADDFVLIESKKIAFGLSNAADDLRTFFRACENAPILESFQNGPTLNEILIDLDQQLLMYESKVSEFDDLIKSLESN